MPIRTQVVLLEEIMRTPSKGSSPRGPCILVVDDEALIADTLTTILTQAGYSVHTAYDGLSALALVLHSSAPPDLLLTDVCMHGMNGIELALAIVKTKPSCRVLLFSGSATGRDLMEAHATDSNFTLLQKPLHPRTLISHIETLLSEKPASPKPITVAVFDPSAAIGETA